MVIVLGSHYSEKFRVIKGLCCVFAYDNCLWKQGQCTHLKLLSCSMFNLVPKNPGNEVVI